MATGVDITALLRMRHRMGARFSGASLMDIIDAIDSVNTAAASQTQVDTNATNIVANANAIDLNASEITGNTTNITTNTTNIATNTTNIATNTTNISGHETRITSLEGATGAVCMYYDATGGGTWSGLGDYIPLTPDLLLNTDGTIFGLDGENKVTVTGPGKFAVDWGFSVKNTSLKDHFEAYVVKDGIKIGGSSCFIYINSTENNSMEGFGVFEIAGATTVTLNIVAKMLDNKGTGEIYAESVRLRVSKF